MVLVISRYTWYRFYKKLEEKLGEKALKIIVKTLLGLLIALFAFVMRSNDSVQINTLRT